MNNTDRAFFHNQLIEANRALISLGRIDLKERTAIASVVVRECMQAYAHLLHVQGSTPLLPDEAASLQGLLDRLRAQLTFFGKDV